MCTLTRGIRSLIKQVWSVNIITIKLSSEDEHLNFQGGFVTWDGPSLYLGLRIQTDTVQIEAISGWYKEDADSITKMTC